VTVIDYYAEHTPKDRGPVIWRLLTYPVPHQKRNNCSREQLCCLLSFSNRWQYLRTQSNRNISISKGIV